MAFKLAEAYVQLSSRGMGTVGRALGTIKSKLTALINPATMVASAMASIGTGLTIKSMIELAVRAENLAVSFEVLLGSAEKAKQMMAEINEFAARTPFEQGELAGVTKQLLTYGVAQKDIIPTMQKLGDMAALSGVQLNELASIFGKSKGTGLLMTDTLDMFLDRGIPLGRELAKIFGVAETEIRKMAPTGKITFAILQEALANLTGEGGQFYDGMRKLSGTTGGLWSTFTGNLKMALGKIGAKMIEAFDLKKIITNMGKFATEFWPSYGGKITRALREIGNTVKNLFPVGKITRALREIGNTVKNLFPVVKDLGVLFAHGASVIARALKVIHSALGNVGTALTLLTALLWANPFRAIVGGIILAVGWLERFRKESSQVSHVLATKARKEDALRQKDKERLARLQQLASKQKLSNAETAEANSLIQTLSGRYDNLKLSINDATGAIEGMAQAHRDMAAAQKEAKITELRGLLAETQANQSALLAEQKELYSVKSGLAHTLTGAAAGAALGASKAGLAGAAIGGAIGIGGGSLYQEQKGQAIEEDLAAQRRESQRLFSVLKAILTMPKTPGGTPLPTGAPGGAPGALPTATAAGKGKFGMTSLAGLADQMQNEAVNRLAERTAAATERTAVAVEQIAGRTETAQTSEAPVPAFQ